MIAKITSTVLQGGGGELGGLVLVVIVVLGLLYALSSIFGGDGKSSATEELSDLYFDDDDELLYDFTNDDVQQWLRTNDGLEQLEDWVDDDLARPIHEGTDESHYAVLNFWWYTLAKELGFPDPEADEEYTEFTIAVAFTAAYENHSDRVGDVPELDDGSIGTSPFIVEHTRNSAAGNDLLEERTESELI
ncbi:hypothetical protein [Halocatena halophila]|uniref:hypothetical protein n=1 Tax=Halocatena halophila TaxID=2814576 RepID=UPI002ED6B6CD